MFSPLNPLTEKQMPSHLRPWLTQAYILTQHLKACGNWQLKRLREGHEADGAWTREIYHCLEGVPVVYARVEVPAATYEVMSRQLGSLQDKPIGETLLYHNKCVKRSGFRYACLEDDKASLKHLKDDNVRDRITFARQSTFYWQGHPLTITEYFINEMPAFPKLKNPQQMKESIMSKLQDYVHLIRLHRPIPILLMLWPTLWALWLAAQGKPHFSLVLIFIAGVVVMRSAGDILNDLADRRFDGFVERTHMRPLATGRIRVRSALIFVVCLLLIALVLVLLLNRLCLYLAIVGLGLAILYPFMKRLTYFPQFILGLAYNWGIIMAFAAVQDTVPLSAWLLFAGSVSWTIAYDTMYALADRKDDLKMGLKSTAVLFGDHYHFWIGVFQVLALGLFASVGWFLNLTVWYFAAVALFIPFFIYQHRLLPGHGIKNCVKAFNNNHWPAMILWLVLLLTLS